MFHKPPEGILGSTYSIYKLPSNEKAKPLRDNTWRSIYVCLLKLDYWDDSRKHNFYSRNQMMVYNHACKPDHSFFNNAPNRWMYLSVILSWHNMLNSFPIVRLKHNSESCDWVHIMCDNTLPILYVSGCMAWHLMVFPLEVDHLRLHNNARTATLGSCSSKTCQTHST